MQSKLFFASVLLCTLHSFVASESRCWKAYQKCDFRFKKGKPIPTFGLNGRADAPFTSRIIMKPGVAPVGKEKLHVLGVLNTNRIKVEIVTKKSYVSITKLRSTPRLRPTHIKPLTIKKTTGSGLGHQMLNKSQKTALRRQCVRIFFMEYELLNDKNTVKMNFNNVPRRKRKCVVFKTK